MSKLYFKEIQRFRNTWVWLPNLVMVAILIYVYIQEYTKKSSDIAPPEYWYLLFLLIPVGVIVLFYIGRMETEVRRDGIYFRFVPFINKFRLIRWEEISKCYVRKYHPIVEYGGWGIRTGRRRSNVAYNIKGRTGLQIELKNGKKILLGTQKGNDLTETLNSLDKTILHKSYEE